MSLSGPYGENSDAKSAVDVSERPTQHHLAFKTDEVDTGAQLVAVGQGEVDPAEGQRLRRKINWHTLPLMCSESFGHLETSEVDSLAQY